MTIECKDYLQILNVASLPTPGASYRGMLVRVQGAGGVADQIYVCEKNASDTYEWVKINIDTWAKLDKTTSNIADITTKSHTALTDIGTTAHTAIDAQLPGTGEKAALAGTTGTPSGTNKYVTDADTRNSNARTPTSHGSTHDIGGTDALSGKFGIVQHRVNATDVNFVHKEVQAVSNITAWATIKTIAPSTVTNIYLSGIVQVRIHGGTNVAGNGTRLSKWYFDFAGAAPTVGIVGTDTVTGGSGGTGPGAAQFQLIVSGNNILLQIKSSNGTNTFAGMVFMELDLPKETIALTYTLT